MLVMKAIPVHPEAAVGQTPGPMFDTGYCIQSSSQLWKEAGKLKG